MSDIFTFLSTAFPPTAHVTAFAGREAISRAYEFDIALKVMGIDVDVASAVGARATLAVDRGLGGLPMLQHGILSSVELVNDFGSFGLYVARLVPLYWQLTLTRHSRIFTDASIPEIIEALLKEGGLSGDDYRLSLWGSYPKLEHVCQYRESNHDFIARLAEREGIYYYFEQGVEREVVVFTDTRAVHKQLSPFPVKYYPAPLGDVSAGESLRTFKCKSSAQPGRVRVSDYNYLKPSLEVTGSADLAGKGDIVLWGENVKTPDESARYAAIRAEEIAARRTLYTGMGPQFYLRPGYTFLLEEHPRIPFNGQYLAVEVVHVGNQSATPEELAELFGVTPTKEVYVATVQSIPHGVQWRAARATPWPRIDGVVDGVVDGSAESPYAQIDPHGRYKVSIFFDEGDLTDGSRSTWVRMLQPHGGSVEGHHFPLRKGTEVHIVFLGGDPDRPVIVGAAHNAEKPSVVTQANYTKNMIRSGSNNYLEMEDQLGATHVHVYAPKHNSQLHLGNGQYNFDLKTDKDGRLFTGANHDVVVVANMTEKVGGSIDEAYEGPFTTQVTNAVAKTYNATFDETVQSGVTRRYKSILDMEVIGQTDMKYQSLVNLAVQGVNTETYESAFTKTVNGMTSFTHNASRRTEITGTDDLVCNGPTIIHVTGSQTETIDATYSLTVGGSLVTKIGADHTITTAGPEKKIDVGSFDWSVMGAKTDLFAGGSISVSVGVGISVFAGLQGSFTSGVSISNAPIKLSGKGVKLNSVGAHLKKAGAGLKKWGLDLDVAGLHVKS